MNIQLLSLTPSYSGEVAIGHRTFYLINGLRLSPKHMSAMLATVLGFR